MASRWRWSCVCLCVCAGGLIAGLTSGQSCYHQSVTVTVYAILVHPAQTVGDNCSVLFFSRPRSEGWPHHGRTFSIYLCPLSLWLTLPREVRPVLSCPSCCPSRPCVVFLACVHLTLLIALSLSPSNSLLSSWCDNSMLASLLWPCLTVSLFTPALLRTHSFVFFAVRETRRIFLSPFISKASSR